MHQEAMKQMPSMNRHSSLESIPEMRKTVHRKDKVGMDEKRNSTNSALERNQSKYAPLITRNDDTFNAMVMSSTQQMDQKNAPDIFSGAAVD